MRRGQERWLDTGADALPNSAWRDVLVKGAGSKEIGYSAESYDHMGSALRVLISQLLDKG